MHACMHAKTDSCMDVPVAWFFRKRYHVTHHAPKPRPMSYQDAFKEPVVIAKMVGQPLDGVQHIWNVTGCSWEVGCLDGLLVVSADHLYQVHAAELHAFSACNIFG